MATLRWAPELAFSGAVRSSREAILPAIQFIRSSPFSKALAVMRAVRWRGHVKGSSTLRTEGLGRQQRFQCRLTSVLIAGSTGRSAPTLGRLVPSLNFQKAAAHLSADGGLCLDFEEARWEWSEMWAATERKNSPASPRQQPGRDADGLGSSGNLRQAAQLKSAEQRHGGGLQRDEGSAERIATPRAGDHC